jgi:hypothetical protein
MPQKYSHLAQPLADTYSLAFLWHLKGIVVPHKFKPSNSVALKCILVAQKCFLLPRRAASPSPPSSLLDLGLPGASNS